MSFDVDSIRGARAGLGSAVAALSEVAPPLDRVESLDDENADRTRASTSTGLEMMAVDRPAIERGGRDDAAPSSRRFALCRRNMRSALAAMALAPSINTSRPERECE